MKRNKECRICRGTERYKNGRCAVCARSYYKEHRAANLGAMRAKEREYRERNKERVAAVCKRWRAENPERVLSLRRDAELRAIGFSTIEYEALLAKQKGACEICGTAPSGRRKPLAVDRCRSTEKVRGLLCHLCNLGLKRFEPEWFGKATAYLERTGT